MVRSAAALQRNPAVRPIAKTALAEPAFIAEAPAPAAGFSERKRVVKELKELVKLLDRGKKS